jgi:flagellin
MSRINSNIPASISRSNLARANSDLSTRLQRLSTGLRINRGADDPAGLIISQRLGSEISGLQQAIKNSERASSVISTAEGSLAEANDLLNSIKGLVVEAANTGAISDEEREANQLQINSAIDSITRISNSASFGGLKLLNGSLDYVLSGVKASAISQARIYNANFAGQKSINVKVQTIASAQVGELFLPPPATGGAVLQSSVNLEIGGNKGVQTLTFISGTAFSAVVAAINSFAEATGVKASYINGNVNSGIVFAATEYGASQFASVKRLNEPASGVATSFQTYALKDGIARSSNINITALLGAGSITAATRDTGRDVYAIVNGVLGTGNGLKLSLPSTGTIGLDLLLNKDLATTNNATSSFDITGGGALYQLGGDINYSQQVNLGLQSIAAARIGGVLQTKTVAGVTTSNLEFLESIKSGGTNELKSGNFEAATKILTQAIDEISRMRGRLGALEKNTLDTNVRSIQAAVENLTSSQSVIRDADFAAESSALSRSQVLVSAATSTLALANQSSQSVLQLLRQ